MADEQQYPWSENAKGQFVKELCVCNLFGIADVSSKLLFFEMVALKQSTGKMEGCYISVMRQIVSVV